MIRWEDTIHYKDKEGIKSYKRKEKSISKLEKQIVWEKGSLIRQKIINSDVDSNTAVLNQENKIRKMEAELQELKNGKSHKGLKRKIKKRSNNWIKEQVLILIKKEKEKGSFYIQKEDVARILQVKECQVEQVFHQLNLEGILTKAVHHAPHDSQRDPWGFIGNMAWSGDLYYFVRKENSNG